MRVSNSRQLGSVKSNIKLWETIDRIQKVLQVSDETYADLLELTLPEFFKLKSSRTALSAHSFYSLNGRLNLSSEKMYRGDIDYIALDRSWRGDQFYIPERYRENAYSKVGNIKFFFDHVEDRFGLTTKFEILRFMQLPMSIFSEGKKNISIQVVFDLFRYLSSKGVKDEYFTNVGYDIQLKQLQTLPFASVIKERSDIIGVYESYITEHANYVDRNMCYRIVNMRRNSIVIQYDLNEEAALQMKKNVFEARLVCKTKFGIAKGLIGLSPVGKSGNYLMKKTKCVFHGDSCCEIQINL